MREGAASKKAWNRECYANFSTDRHSRDWVDAVKYGFLSAGGSSRYSGQLRSLSPGERVWVKVAPYGFVGVGLVNGDALPAKSFKVKASGSHGRQIPVRQAHLLGTYHRQYVDNLELCEYFVPMLWLQTVPLNKAIREVGLFGNQNTVCRPIAPDWRLTVERLKVKFPDFDKGLERLL